MPLNSQPSTRFSASLEQKLPFHRWDHEPQPDQPARNLNLKFAPKKRRALKEAPQMTHTKCCIVLLAGTLALGPLSSAKNPAEAKTEQDRLQNAGKVMQEILNIPDDIPQDLLDKARCVVVMPSV